MTPAEWIKDTQLTGLLRAVEHFGGKANLCRALGYTPSQYTPWERRGYMSVNAAKELIALCPEHFTMVQLRPTIEDWVALRKGQNA